MPVSKKKVYKERQFTNTSGYRKNTHRDKSGRTQQERENDRIDRQHARRLRNQVEAHFLEQELLGQFKSFNKLVSKKEEK